MNPKNAKVRCFAELQLEQKEYPSAMAATEKAPESMLLLVVAEKDKS